MATIDLRNLNDDEFIFRFGGPPSRIDVYTLALALTGFADALREINRVVSPDTELEIFIDSIGPGGSVLAKVITKKTVLGVLGFIATETVLGLFVNYLYDQLTKDELTVMVGAEEVIVKTGDQTVIIKKEAFEHAERVGANPKVAAGVRRAVEAIREDDGVDSVAILPDKQTPPVIEIPRHRFNDLVNNLDRTFHDISALVPEAALVETPHRRIQIERTQLVIIKAVFERGRRKWEFNWSGVKISAAITDESFFDRLERREFALSQGDALDVDLTITQHYSTTHKAWENVLYEVSRVHGVIGGPGQLRITL